MSAQFSPLQKTAIALSFIFTTMAAPAFALASDKNAIQEKTITQACKDATDKEYETLQDLDEAITACHDIDARDKYKNTPLIQAALWEEIEILSALIQNGADMNARGSSYRKETPLMVAAREGKIHSLIVLINAHADINAVDAFGRTPLMTAARAGEKEILKMLIKVNADIHIKDKKEKTVLDNAIDGLHSCSMSAPSDCFEKRHKQEEIIMILKNTLSGSKEKLLETIRNTPQP